MILKKQVIIIVEKTIKIKCPFCGSDNVSKNGHNKTGKQFYNCKNEDCSHRNFIEKCTYKACEPEVRKQVLKNDCKLHWNTCNRSYSWNIKRHRHCNFKKTEKWSNEINLDYINSNHGVESIAISSEQIEIDEAEMDEMWSFVHNKSQQYWLWWAIDHNTGIPLAYCFGTRGYKYLDELCTLLSPFKINIVYSDNNFAYKKYITESKLITGKRNTQKIERKHLSLRNWCSRLVRKGIRFSKSHLMHKIVVGLIINYWFFNKELLFHLIQDITKISDNFKWIDKIPNQRDYSKEISTSWWEMDSFTFSKSLNIADKEWSSDENILPNFAEYLMRTNREENIWYVLRGFSDYNKNLEMGEEKTGRKENLWYRINSVIVRKDNRQEVIDSLEKMRLESPDVFSPTTFISEIFYGEFYWTQYFNRLDKTMKKNFWKYEQRFDNLEIELHIPTNEYFWEYNADDSSFIESPNCYLPSQHLIEELELLNVHEQYGTWENHLSRP